MSSCCMHSTVYRQSRLQLLTQRICGLGAHCTACRAHSVQVASVLKVEMCAPHPLWFVAVSKKRCLPAPLASCVAYPLLYVLPVCAAAAAAALQAWLEVAWQAGFDPGGAAMFGAAVQCSRKWIGTTEAAALLRYFGCRALIVDFYGERGGPCDCIACVWHGLAGVIAVYPTYYTMAALVV